MGLPAVVQPLQRLTARQMAFEQLRTWIESGELAPGALIRDAEVATALGISRTPVREALQSLELMGAVETSPSRHTLVAPLPRQLVDRLLPVLSTLHQLAVRQLPNPVPAAVISQLETHNKALSAAVKRNDPVEANNADQRFHTVFIDSANNSFISAALEPVAHQWRRYNALYFKHRSPSEESVAEHRSIIKALRAGDIETAADLVAANIGRQAVDAI